MQTTGKDIVDMMLQIAHHASGRTFTIYVDMDTAMQEFTVPEYERVTQRGIEELQQRMKAVQDKWIPLRQSLYDSGIMFDCVERGPAIRLEQQLTEQQQELYAQLKDELDGLDTFIKIV